MMIHKNLTCAVFAALLSVGPPASAQSLLGGATGNIGGGIGGGIDSSFGQQGAGNLMRDAGMRETLSDGRNRLQETAPQQRAALRETRREAHLERLAAQAAATGSGNAEAGNGMLDGTGSLQGSGSLGGQLADSGNGAAVLQQAAAGLTGNETGAAAGVGDSARNAGSTGQDAVRGTPRAAGSAQGAANGSGMISESATAVASGGGSLIGQMTASGASERGEGSTDTSPRSPLDAASNATADGSGMAQGTGALAGDGGSETGERQQPQPAGTAGPRTAPAMPSRARASGSTDADADARANASRGGASINASGSARADGSIED